MRHFVIYSLSVSTVPFRIISKTARFSQKKTFEQKICDWIFSTNLSVRAERDVTITVHWSSSNVLLPYSCWILMNLELSRHIVENILISNFMKIRPLEAEFFHTDGWLDRQTDRQIDKNDGANSRFSKFCEST
jgi:hypothetical protein